MASNHPVPATPKTTVDWEKVKLYSGIIFIAMVFFSLCIFFHPWIACLGSGALSLVALGFASKKDKILFLIAAGTLIGLAIVIFASKSLPDNSQDTTAKTSNICETCSPYGKADGSFSFDLASEKSCQVIVPMKNTGKSYLNWDGPLPSGIAYSATTDGSIVTFTNSSSITRNITYHLDASKEAAETRRMRNYQNRQEDREIVKNNDTGQVATTTTTSEGPIIDPNEEFKDEE